MNQKQLNKEDWGKVERKRGFFRSYARDFGKVTAGNAIMLGANMIIFVLHKPGKYDTYFDIINIMC